MRKTIHIKDKIATLSIAGISLLSLLLLSCNKNDAGYVESIDFFLQMSGKKALMQNELFSNKTYHCYLHSNNKIDFGNVSFFINDASLKTTPIHSEGNSLSSLYFRLEDYCGNAVFSIKTGEKKFEETINIVNIDYPSNMLFDHEYSNVVSVEEPLLIIDDKAALNSLIAHYEFLNSFSSYEDDNFNDSFLVFRAFPVSDHINKYNFNSVFYLDNLYYLEYLTDYSSRDENENLAGYHFSLIELNRDIREDFASQITFSYVL